MKKIFFSLALIASAALIGNEVSVDTVKKGAVCVVEDTKAGCPICPVKCSTCGKTVVDENAPEDQEAGDEVKCGCSKPKPKAS